MLISGKEAACYIDCLGKSLIEFKIKQGYTTFLRKILYLLCLEGGRSIYYWYVGEFTTGGDCKLIHDFLAI